VFLASRVGAPRCETRQREAPGRLARLCRATGRILIQRTAGARVAALIIGPKYHCNGTEPPPPGSDPIYPFCDWTTDSFEKLRNLIAELVPNADYHDVPPYHQQTAMDRIERLDLNKHFEAEEEMTKIWADISPAPDAYKNFAEQIPASSSTSPTYEKGIAAQW
jgi:hypothetical protein